MRDVYFLSASTAWLSGSRLGHDPFAFVLWALGPQAPGEEDLAKVLILSQIESPARASMQCLLDKWMGGSE